GSSYTADGQGIELSGSQFALELDGTTLSKSASGLKLADGFASTLLTTSTPFGGDVTGTYNSIVVSNDSHSHASTTLPANTTYLGSTIEFAEWGSTCSNGQVVKYNAVLSQWECANDNDTNTTYSAGN